jgi:hypothetical protein
VKEISSANAAEVNETIRSLRNKIRDLERGSQDAGELQQLQTNAKEMKDFIDMIRSKDSSGLVQHLDALRLYCGHRDKERVAVRKIFEDKIKGVVDNVVKGLIGTQVNSTLPSFTHGVPFLFTRLLPPGSSNCHARLAAAAESRCCHSEGIQVNTSPNCDVA